MPILVSFVNQFYSPELSLGLYDETDGSFVWIIPEGRPVVANGAAGITSHDDSIYVCYQKSGLIVYDRSFRVRQVFEFGNIADGHTCMVHDGALFVVSSGTDEIYRLPLDASGLVTAEEPFWKNPAAKLTGVDENHVNSLTMTPDGRMLATCFGARHKDGWPSTVDGALMDITSGEVIKEGIRHPHSVFCHAGDIFVCESLNRRLISLKGCSVELGGYVRGVCETDGHIVVASSARRRWSKSRKKVVNINDAVGENESDSILYFLDKDSLDVARKVVLTTYGREIFDLEWFAPGVLKAEAGPVSAVAARVNAMEDALIGFAGEVDRLETDKNYLLRKLDAAYGSYSYRLGNAVVRHLSWLLKR